MCDSWPLLSPIRKGEKIGARSFIVSPVGLGAHSKPAARPPLCLPSRRGTSTTGIGDRRPCSFSTGVCWLPRVHNPDRASETESRDSRPIPIDRHGDGGSAHSSVENIVNDQYPPAGSDVHGKCEYGRRKGVSGDQPHVYSRRLGDVHWLDCPRITPSEG